MLSEIPIDLSKVPKDQIDFEILRAGIIAEADAVNLYEQMAAMSQSEDIKKILMDIAKEEKTHIGEFEALLLELDTEQAAETLKGRKEVQEMGIELQQMTCPALYAIKEDVMGGENTTYIAAHSEEQAWVFYTKRGDQKTMAHIPEETEGKDIRQFFTVVEVAQNLCGVKPGDILGGCYDWP